MEKNVAILDLQEYDNLKNFKEHIQKDMVVMSTHNHHYTQTYTYYHKDDFHKEIERQVNYQKDKVTRLEHDNEQLKETKEKLEDKILDLIEQVNKKTKLNFMQRLFNAKII